MARTITSANAQIFLSVEGLYTTPRQIQGFSADNIFGMDSYAPNEVSMGVDGVLSGGFVHVPKPMNITLQADSLSNDFFERWNDYMIRTKEAAIASGITILTATNRKYTMTRGFLTNYSPAPTANKTLQPRAFQITWGSVSGSTAL